MSDIVLATDGSSYSVAAAKFIVEEGMLRADSKVHIIHVSTPLTGRAASFVGKQAVDEWHAEESAKAIEPTAEVFKTASVPYETHNLVGHAPQEIVDFANRVNAKVIVMGAHGRGAILDAVIGSVANRVLSLAKRPVLLV